MSGRSGSLIRTALLLGAQLDNPLDDNAKAKLKSRIGLLQKASHEGPFLIVQILQFPFDGLLFTFCPLVRVQ